MDESQSLRFVISGTGKGKGIYADMHCHTTCSDGTLTPQKIIQLAVKTGLKGLSITDHDTIDAYATAIPAAKEQGINLLPGVEFSAKYRETSVHILAYAFSVDNPIIQEFCQQHKMRRNRRILAILKRLETQGMKITEEDLPSHQGSRGRPHIALAMQNKGYVRTIQEAFRNYLSEGQCCFVPGDEFSVEETLNTIHAAKGIAILAHPQLIKRQSRVKQLLQMPFDGLEGYYAKFPLHIEKRWVDIATQKKWIITGGSDFHGDYKEHITLGCSWVPEETFRILENHHKQNQKN